MRNQISMKMNWSAGKRGEKEVEDESENNKMKKIIKQCCLKTRHENQSSASWSDLDLNLLREIKKKISNYADHIRFGRVCKSWRSVGSDDEKRAGDVLPWLLALGIQSETVLSYELQEPPLFIYHTDTVIRGMINVCDYFNDISEDNISTIASHRCAGGWLYISLYNLISNSSSNLLLFSLTTKASFTLPQFNHYSTHPLLPQLNHCSNRSRLYLAWSTTPDSPDCVFFAMSITDPITRTIGIFRHGDTHWTTTQSVGGIVFGKLIVDDFVFINGVFYFFITYGGNFGFGIGFYDLATGALNFEVFSTNLMFYKTQNFFGLDGDLMLAYFEQETRKLCIRKYDCSNKDWVPLQSLGGRSLYLSTHSVYVDQINYYSANKIYVYIGNNETSCVDEYTLEDDGQLSQCTSTRLTSWFDPWPIWVPPPDVRLRR